MSFSAPLKGFHAQLPGSGPVVETILDRLRMLDADVGGGPPGLFGLSGPGVSVEASPREPFPENLVQADCGIMALHGRSEAQPRPLGVDYVSILTGIATVQGMLAATLAQLRGNPVARIELDANGVALLAVGQYIAAATADEDPEGYEDLPSTARPPFVSADGIAFEVESFSGEAWQGFWSSLGAPERAIARGWRPFLLRYERASAVLPRELHEAVESTSFEEIRAVAASTGMHVCPVRTVSERRADPDAGLPPWTLRAGRAAPPASGSGAGLPLAGIHVVESTRRVQGPLATRLLSLLGATVTRIEPPGGDPLRGMPPMAGDCSAKFRVLNDGKRIAEIDFKSAAGRDEVMDLIRDADVFLHNWAPGKDVELGLDAAAMHAVNPGLVYAAACGWGDALGTRPPAGTDYMVQAYSGVADALTPAGEPPRPTLMIMVDIAGGFVSAEGIVAALVARQRTGRGGSVTTSLLAAADALLREPSPAAVDGVFAAADGLLAIVTEDVEALCSKLDIPVPPPEELADAITKALGTRPMADWEGRLGSIAVPVRRDLGSLVSRHPARFERNGCAIAVSPWIFGGASS
ncbi:CoA transferase [Amycolatopsis keratiniphila]|uniref:Acyl-CoA transferase/carnitine dehydratase n=2 Tax=Actinomycetes TaxID=1760 RepID=R4T0P0_9PSEU|nr:CoA transferase [Amycolatopsis keratiniphila]AGM09179.1 acyl-CoA transferase/carnitine dehydratase [Amycolatopsis keratiniphila]